jgi:membrane protease YdiL (CAAX protease family)
MSRPSGKAVALRVAVFAVLSIAGMVLLAEALLFIGGSPWYLVASVVSVFGSAAVANALCIRIYEGGRLNDVGFAWNAAARCNLALGLGGGFSGAALVLGLPLAAGAAHLAPVPRGDASLLFVFVLLVFGATGEEMLFHGYGFQVLLAALGAWGTILPTSVLFAWAHSSNLNVSPLGLANTAAWGALLGWAFWRSGDLWLPIGLHVGWNWSLPLFGANLSGFTINVTGYAIRWRIPPLWSGGDYGPEGGLLTSAVLALLFFGLWKAPVRRQHPLLLKARWEV